MVVCIIFPISGIISTACRQPGRQAPLVQNNKVGGRLPTILEPVTSIACLCMLPTFVA